MVSDTEGRMKERRIFLFEQVVIFSEPLDKKKGFSLPGFVYKNSIKVTDMHMRSKHVYSYCVLSGGRMLELRIYELVKGFIAPSGGETSL